MPGTLLRFDKLVNTTRFLKSARPDSGGRFQTAERRLVAEVDLAVALVAGDHEAVPVAQLEKLFPIRHGHHGAGGIARRADIHQLRARPTRRRECRPS